MRLITLVIGFFAVALGAIAFGQALDLDWNEARVVSGKKLRATAGSTIQVDATADLTVTGDATFADLSSAGTAALTSVDVGSGGAIEMLKASTLVFPTTTTTTVAVSGVLPGDTVVATPNVATTHALKSAAPSTDTLTFVWAGDNSTTVTVGVIIAR